MAELKMKLKDVTVTKATDPIIEQKVEVVFKEKITSNWNILPGKKEGEIYARSSKGDVFEGTTAEFNRLMKG